MLTLLRQRALGWPIASSPGGARAATAAARHRCLATGDMSARASRNCPRSLTACGAAEGVNRAPHSRPLTESLSGAGADRMRYAIQLPQHPAPDRAGRRPQGRPVTSAAMQQMMGVGEPGLRSTLLARHAPGPRIVPGRTPAATASPGSRIEVAFILGAGPAPGRTAARADVAPPATEALAPAIEPDRQPESSDWRIGPSGHESPTNRLLGRLRPRCKARVSPADVERARPSTPPLRRGRRGHRPRDAPMAVPGQPGDGGRRGWPRAVGPLRRAP